MTLPAHTFSKRRRDAPPGFFAVEAAGLRWLAEAGGAEVVQPLDVGPEVLVLPRLVEVEPSREAAAAFGEALALTHKAGAEAFGAPPADWSGDGFIGPITLPHRPSAEWGPFFAECRIAHYQRIARDAGALDASEAAAVDHVVERLLDGDLDTGEAPSRLHGDLWSGNVLWCAAGVVLVDPAAHGGHRESDLAMLSLFGLPHLEAMVTAYDAAAPLATGWQDRMALHQLHPLLVHAVLFGGVYGARAADAARRYA